MVLPNLLINYHITREKAIVESENNDKKVTSYVVQLHNFLKIEQNWYNSALKNAARWNLRHKGDDCAEREGGMLRGHTRQEKKVGPLLLIGGSEFFPEYV